MHFFIDKKGMFFYLKLKKSGEKLYDVREETILALMKSPGLITSEKNDL